MLWLQWDNRVLREAIVLPFIIGIMLIPIGIFSGLMSPCMPPCAVCPALMHNKIISLHRQKTWLGELLRSSMMEHANAVTLTNVSLFPTMLRARRHLQLQLGGVRRWCWLEPTVQPVVL